MGPALGRLFDFCLSKARSHLACGLFLSAVGAMAEHPAAYASARLRFDTKLELRKILELSFSEHYFSVRPFAPHGQIPRLKRLHTRMVRIVATAFAAASK